MNIWYYLSLFMAQVMVGINIAGSKYLLLHMSAIALLCFRFFVGSTLLYLMQLCIPTPKGAQTLQQLSKRDWAYLIAQALTAGILFNFIMLAGLHYTSASIAGIITSALPAMVAVLSLIFLREKLSLLSGLCILFSIVGLLIINAHNFQTNNLNHLFGDVLIFTALIPEAVFYILVKMHHTRLPIFKLSALLNAINLPITLLLAWYTHAFANIHFNNKTIVVLSLVSLSSGLFYVFWGLGAKKVSGTTTGLFTALMPITTLFLAWVFLHESISLIQSIGMALVIMAILLNAFWKNNRTSKLS